MSDKNDNTEVEVVSTTAPKSKIDPEESRLRNEAMDAALDITATTTKLKAEEALKAAKAAQDKTKAALYKAYAAFKAALYKAATSLAAKQPVVAAVQKLGAILADVELTADDVFRDVRVFNRTAAGIELGDSEDDNHLNFTVDAYPICSIDFRRSEGSKSTHYEGDKTRMEMSIADDAELMALWNTWNDANIAYNLAVTAVDEAKERRDNIPDQTDVARVALQKHKLESMGSPGQEVLDRVQDLLKATDGAKNLKMLDE